MLLGRVAEWPNASVLKTESPLRVTGVRIPPLPNAVRKRGSQLLGFREDSKGGAMFCFKTAEPRPGWESLLFRTSIENSY